MPHTAVALLLLHLITRISAQEGCDGYVWATEDDGQGNVIMTIQKTDAHGLEVGDEVFLHGMRDETGAAMDAVARLYEGNHRVGNWTSSRDENELQFQVHDRNVPCTAANECPSEGPIQRICVTTGWRPSLPPSPSPTPSPPLSASPAPPVQSESESADVGGIVGGVVGGCFVPVLMCALWLGGVFAKYGCPSPIKKQKADSGPQLTGTVYVTGDRL